MPYYRKKPIPVEARQFTGDNFLELQDWSNDLVALSDNNEDVICVHTLEGPVWGEKGDFVVKGVRGEFYVCQRDIFEETYEPLDKRDAATSIRPTPVKTMKPGDLFRDGGQTFQIADIEQNDDVVEIVYYTGTSSFINSFFLSLDDTLDKVVNTTPSSSRRRASKPWPMSSSTSTVLSTPSSGSPPTTESIRFN